MLQKLMKYGHQACSKGTQLKMNIFYIIYQFCQLSILKTASKRF